MRPTVKQHLALCYFASNLKNGIDVNFIGVGTMV